LSNFRSRLKPHFFCLSFPHLVSWIFILVVFR
jgi:hypothetical protein